MVGTPQLPLKFRRKGDKDLCAYTSPYLSPISPTPSNFGSEYSMPSSPTFYSSSSSVAPSSPIRALQTPEPPSSPFAEPYVASSSKSPRPESRKGFWEVAFNYGPDFPYKNRTAAKTSSYDREPFFARRRSSSASAPALVSDIDASEYSEDVDPFHIDDDGEDGLDTSGNITIVNPKEEFTVVGSEVSALPLEKPVDTKEEGKAWDGEIDVASVLLDLSRKVRLAPVESKRINVTTETVTQISPELQQVAGPPRQDEPIALADTSTLETGNTNALPPIALQDEIASYDSEEPVEISNLEECKADQELIAPAADEVRTEDLVPTDVSLTNDVDESPRITEVPLVPAASHDFHSETLLASEKSAIGEKAPAFDGLLVKDELLTDAEIIVDDKGILDVDPIIESIFSSALTPISSPSLAASKRLDPIEPLSELSSPGTSVIELMGPSPTDNMRYSLDKDDMEILSRSSSPVPGPSNSRAGSADQHAAPAKRKSGHSKKRSRSALGTEEPEEAGAKAIGKKRSRRASLAESRPASPVPSESRVDVPRPRKKKKGKQDGDKSRQDGGSATTDLECVPLPSPSTAIPTVPSHSSSPVPRDTEMDVSVVDDDTDAKAEMCGCLIQAMALSRASSMPASSLLREVLRENKHMNSQRCNKAWLEIIQVVLKSHAVFGRVERVGLDAEDKPLEAQWFYIPENDPDQDRASLLREMMPKKRNETKKHKQYFYKPLGKISRWDAEDAP